MLRLTREQSRQVDQCAIDEYGIPGIVLMENAARGVADAAGEMLRGEVGAARILILVGGGNNGGDGLAAARHLHNRGAALTLMLATDREKFRGDALVNWRIVQAMGLAVQALTIQALPRMRPDLIIDAIFGTGLTHAPRPPFEALAAALEAHPTPLLSVDLPSGLDADSGEPLGACLRARRTVTFVAEKAGFANPTSRAYTGVVTVADIGAPRELIDRISGK